MSESVPPRPKPKPTPRPSYPPPQPAKGAGGMSDFTWGLKPGEVAPVSEGCPVAASPTYRPVPRPGTTGGAVDSLLTASPVTSYRLANEALRGAWIA